MAPTKKAVQSPSDALYRTIRKHLIRKAKGRETIKAFEKDRQGNGELLVNYLREQFPKDDKLKNDVARALGDESGSQINNFITGGKIDQLINIGRVDHLTLLNRISPFRDLKQLVAFIAILLVVAGGIYAGYWKSIQPRKLTGKFNIAIAQLGEITDDGIRTTALSTRIGNSLQTYLDTEFKASQFGQDVDVSNKNMPLVTEDAEAKLLSEQVNATVVIYGNIYSRGGEATLTPRFFVSPTFVATELAGTAELARPIDFRVSTLHDQKQVEHDLRTRAAILLNFTEALIHLSANDLENAETSVQTAIKLAEPAAESFAGKENLYLIAAHIQTRQKDFDAANGLLDQAFLINANYARGHIARGNIYYTEATQSEPYSEDLLGKALAEYQAASNAKDQPPEANIPIKAQMSIGNIYLLQAQIAGNMPELYSRAIESYQFVTNRCENSEESAVRELAAVNYFSIGIAYERLGEKQSAVDAFKKALDLTSDEKFRVTVQNQLKVTGDSSPMP